MKKIIITSVFVLLIVSFVIGKLLTMPAKKVQQKTVLSNPAEIYLTKLSALAPVLPNSDLQKGVLTATLSSGLTIILDIENPKENWETTLQSILNRSKITGESPKIIDMRFKSPIITYGQK